MGNQLHRTAELSRYDYRLNNQDGHDLERNALPGAACASTAVIGKKILRVWPGRLFLTPEELGGFSSEAVGGDTHRPRMLMLIRRISRPVGSGLPTARGFQV